MLHAIYLSHHISTAQCIQVHNILSMLTCQALLQHSSQPFCMHGQHIVHSHLTKQNNFAGEMHCCMQLTCHSVTSLPYCSKQHSSEYRCITSALQQTALQRIQVHSILSILTCQALLQSSQPLCMPVKTACWTACHHTAACLLKTVYLHSNKVCLPSKRHDAAHQHTYTYIYASL